MTSLQEDQGLVRPCAGAQDLAGGSDTPLGPGVWQLGLESGEGRRGSAFAKARRQERAGLLEGSPAWPRNSRGAEARGQSCEQQQTAHSGCGKPLRILRTVVSRWAGQVRE